MDKAISASEANQHFSALLRDVEHGETFVVMSRGRAVARVSPVGPAPDAAAVANLLDVLHAVPRRSAGDWARADLYD